MNMQELKEKGSFNLSKLLLVAGLLALVFLGGGEDFGIGVLLYFISTLFHILIDVVVLLFIVGIFLALFTAPVWVRRIMGSFGR